MKQHFLDQINILLRHFREESGLSQIEISNLLKIGPRSYQRYESGESVPSIDFLYHASQILGVGVESFISPEDKLHQVGEVTLYNSPQEVLFLNNCDVVKSGILSINDNFLLNMGHEQAFKSILRNKLFLTSESCMALSNPKNTVLNPVAQAMLGFTNNCISTNLLHSSPMNTGILWGTLLKMNPHYFSLKTLIKVPAGHLKCESQCIFINKDNQYAILRTFKTTKIGD